jgi:hypothetical protein
LFALLALAAALTLTLRVAPHYVDFEMVKGVADRLADKNVNEMSREEILEHFKKQFRIEGFRTPLKDILKIERERGRTTLNIEYEIREHLFYNVDVVLVFNDQRIYE